MPMSEPLMSVVIPVFNAERWLVDCLGSVVAQSEARLEIILVNDGSTDGSAAICRRFLHADPRIVYVEGPNRGVSCARNLGLDRARGRYVGFVDSDDRVGPDWAAEMIRLAEGSGDALVICGFTAVDLLAEPVHVTEYVHDATRTLSRLGADEVLSLFHRRMLGTVFNKLYRREWIDRHRIRFDPEIDRGEDLLFNLEYERRVAAGFAVLNRPLYEYVRRAGTSLSATFRPRIFECMLPKLRAWEAYIDARVSEGRRPEIRKGIFDVYGTLFIECLWNAIDSRSPDAPWARRAYARSIMRDETFRRCMRLSSAIEGNGPLRAIVGLGTASGLIAFDRAVRLRRRLGPVLRRSRATDHDSGVGREGA